MWESTPRTEEEIDAVLKKVKDTWMKGKTPHLRLCQLISNVANKDDIFYVEDEELVSMLEEWDKRDVE